ncbi:class I SAM-dependent methyltransferase [Anatilimnocola floriformis]|uniref:class I SAM-dependent methyltransferase n=1 Tax=Anatilimnocola floriformis TaxID=2948575 RepID=UPI0020C27F2E|nr:class I SAM-dependent methyltransferase [Anatilimnocola floriformis]
MSIAIPCLQDTAFLNSLALTRRVSPILERSTKTIQLNYAPAPWVLRKCLETGLVYLENPPEYEQLEENFAWEVTKRLESERRSQVEPISYALRSRWKRFRTRYLSRDKVGALTANALQASPSQQLTLLELGCGDGVNLVNVMQLLPPQVASRCTPVGIEISKKLATTTTQALRPFGGTCYFDNALHGLENLGAQSIDAIILSSYLEHEANPLPTLRHCREALRPHGRIVIKVPNFDCASRYLRGHRWCGFRWPDHVNYFTPKTLRLTLETAGLKVARMNWLDHNPTSDNMYAVAAKV